MISEEELLKEIERCKRDPITHTSIDKLASLYIVHDHLWGNPEPNQAEMHSKKKMSGNSEFLGAINRIEEAEAWAIMDELMSVLRVSNPRLYDAVMFKIS